MIAEVDETTTLAGMGAQEQTLRVCVCVGWLCVRALDAMRLY